MAGVDIAVYWWGEDLGGGMRSEEDRGVDV